ncbi:Calnexin-like protein [Triticum urartu]|uniref:Calnexin-like protein n=1 Tax=Triticum urartu TaxID=4572 RepID=M7Z644_TRIUA|nr:Calnexin-like protein [Triticum urartu]
MEQSVWKHEKSDGHEYYGLLVSESARKYAIVKELDSPVTLKDVTVVLQFEMRLQNGLECGGSFAAPAPANLVDSLMER